MTQRQENIRANNITNGRPVNTRLPYTLEELELIARTAPIKSNCKVLAAALGRSENAVGYIWWLLSCSVKYLKSTESTNPHFEKIIAIKKKVGYCISNTPVTPWRDTEVD